MPENTADEWTVSLDGTFNSQNVGAKPVWARILGSRDIASFFIEGNVNSSFYLQYQENTVVPAINHLNLPSCTMERKSHSLSGRFFPWIMITGLQPYGFLLLNLHEELNISPGKTTNPSRIGRKDCRRGKHSHCRDPKVLWTVDVLFCYGLHFQHLLSNLIC